MEEKIKKEVSFLKNILYVLNEKQKVAMPPTLEDVTGAYSVGVLATLLSMKHLAIGVPLNGGMSSMIDLEIIKGVVNELNLSKEFEELDK